MISWNIYLLPAAASLSPQIGRTFRLQRAEAIADYLIDSEADIVCVQEIFHRRARKRIERRLQNKYPYQFGPANRAWLPGRTNSGLMVFSQIPLEQLGALRFRQARASDRLANKGAQLLRGNFDGVSFQLINTHLQAEPKHEPIRRQQIKQLVEWLEKFGHSDDVRFYCGDFNIDRNDALYLELLEELNTDDRQPTGILTTTWEDLTFDYLFVQQLDDRDVPATVSYQIIEPTRPWPDGSKRGWLSDHRAIVGEVSF